VTPEFTREIRELHLKNLEVDHLVALVDHGVTPAALKKAHQAHPDVDTDDLVELVTEESELEN
jgi:hypothetical protein